MKQIKLSTRLMVVILAITSWLVILPGVKSREMAPNTTPNMNSGVELSKGGFTNSRLARPFSFLPPASPIITATKQDALVNDVNSNGKANPGDTLGYTVVISNTGTGDATGVAFSDTIDPNTTLVPGSVNTSPIAFDDSYSAIGNVSISPNAAQGLLANDFEPDGNTMTVTGNSAPSCGGNLTVNSDGSFTFNPPAGFEGTCTFTYTVSDGQTSPLTNTGTVTITVAGMIWFVDNSQASNGDGRLGTPFNSLPNFVSGAADDPGDNIFLYRQTATNYAGPITLLNNQRLVGQGATVSLSSITGLTPQPYSAPLPATGGTRPVIATGSTNVTIGSGNTIRGLNLSNSGGTALLGSNFGNLSVNDCSITNTNGIAVNLSSGTPTATFTSISSTNGSNGIILSSTGGSFTVTGDGGGSNNGSGGTILTSTGSGIALTNTSNVSLGYLNITNSGTAHTDQTNGDGIHSTGTSGSGLNGLSLIRCNITDNSGETTVNDQGVSLSGIMNGTFNITNCVIGPNPHDNLQVRPTSGTISAFNITGGTITGSVGNSGINFNVAHPSGAATVVTALTIDGVTISNNFADGLQFDTADDSTIMLALVQNCAFTANNVGMDVDTSQSGVNKFKIQNNNFQTQHSVSLNVFADGTGGGVDGKILNNTFGTNNVKDSGSAIGNGIRLNINGQANAKLVVDGNQIHEIPNARGIEAIGRLGTGGANFILTNNTITAPTGSNQAVCGPANTACPLAGLYVEANTGNTVCARITGNNVNYDPAAVPGGLGSEQSIRVRQAGAPAGVFNLEGGFAALSSNNTVANTGSSGTINTVAANTCTTSTVSIVEDPSSVSFSRQLRDDRLFVDDNGLRKIASPTSLSQAELLFIVSAAIERLRALGVGESDLARLTQVAFQVSEQSEGLIARADRNQVFIDPLASGYGWFVDSTPNQDEEFLTARFESDRVPRSSPAFGKIDLLTVVLREMVYVLGADRGVTSFYKSGIMSPRISPNTRRLPSVENESIVEAEPAPKTTSRVLTPSDLFHLSFEESRDGFPSRGMESWQRRLWQGGLIGASGRIENLKPAYALISRRAASLSGETISKTINTLPPGKTVTIVFRVIINNPLPAGVIKVCNQGSVSGSNFSTVQTDDPDTGTAGDSTCTTVCVPAVITVPLTNQQVAKGTTATFTTTYQGNIPFVPVWKKNGTTLVSGVSLGGRATINTSSGATTTTTTLTITGTILTDSDTYTVDATDACNNPATQQSATLTVVAPPTLSKAFGAATIPLNGSTSLTLTLTNPNTGVTLTGVNFSDNLPAGLEVANPASPSTTCSGTWNATPGDTTLNFGGGTLPPNSSCTLTVNIKGTTTGVKNNATNAPQSTEGGTGVASNTATLTVVGPPTISKAFGAATIPLNGTTSLTFTITNPNTTTAITGVGFTDTLPAGLTVATSGPTPTCSGTLTTTTPSTITLTGATIAASGTCTFSVTVTGATAGVKNNTTGAVSSTEGGVGATSNTASVTVVAPPTISKAFGASNIAVGGTTSLTFTITNPNSTVALTGVGFTDTLPAGLSVATSSGSQCGGTLTTTNPSTITLSGATIAASGTCTFSVTVTGVSSGVQNNTTGAVTSTNGGTGGVSNTATVTVATPPTVSKAFGAASIPIGGTTSLTFQITNSNSALTLTGISFTDTLPAGLTAPTTSSSTCGGTLTTTAPSTISFSGGTLPASGTCSFSVTVTGTTAGVKNNTTGVISATESGAGATSNTATLTVVGGASISKAFGAATIPIGGVTTLTFTITNSNTTTALTGVAFTDALPSGLQVAATPNASTSCGGTFTPSAGDTTLTFSGGTIAASGTCTIAVDVTGTTAGVKNNVSGTVTASNAPNGNTANASVTVLAPPTIAKAFGAANIPLGGTTSLTFTITNPNSANSLTGVGFTDTLPAGLTTPNTSGSQCGGTLTVSSNVITLSGASIAASGTCTFSVTVTGATAGVKNNTTGAVTSTNGGTGATSNTATVSVASAPTVTKSFGVSSVLVGGTTSLSFTVSNPNASLALTGISFTDTLPAGITVATSSTSTCGGTLTTTAPSTIAFSGGTLAASGTCSFSVTVTGASAGVWNNTTGAVSSSESGAGAVSNTATLTVIGAPSISKAFDAATIPLNGTSVLTFTVNNANTTTTLTGVNFTDTLPSGLTVPTAGPTAVCGGMLSTTAPNLISFTGGSINPSSNCQITVTVTGATAGVKNNTTGAVGSANGGTGAPSNTATITVVAPPSISKAFGAANIPLGGTTSLTFTITNPNSTVGLTGVGFTDTLPAGLTTPSTSGSQCGGTLTVSSNVITLSGASIAASGTCTFSVTVTGATAGVKNNTTGAVTSTNGGTGATSNTATVSVASAPTVTKSFGVSSVLVGGTTSLSFTVSNPNASLALTGISFTDTLPAGITVATSSTSTCGGTLTTTAPSTIAFSGGTLAASGTCSFSVTVTGASAGVWNNTTGAVSSNESGAGAVSNTATLTVIGAPSISKAFDAATIPLNGTSVLTFTVNNANTTTTLTGVNFTDTLPSGLTVPTAGPTAVCGGMLSTTAPNLISFTGGSINQSSNCQITVTVTGTTAGVKNNTTGAVGSANGGTGAVSNTATITVVAPPSIAKAFGGANVPLNGTTSLTFTLTNPNSTVALTGVAFTDTLPSGLTVPTAGPTSVCGGTLTTTSPNIITFSGGTIAASGTCTMSVTVTGATQGLKNNVTGAVTSTNGGTGNTASASISVASPPTITKAFGAATIPMGATTSLTFTITNSNTFDMTGVGFTDTLPAGLTVASGTSTTCGGGTLTSTAPSTITLAGGSIGAGTSCTFSVTVTGVTAGVKNNTTGAVTSTESGPGAVSNTATVTVLAAPTIAKQFSAPTVPLNGTATLTFTISNPNGTAALAGVAFTDNLPAGLRVASSPNTSTSCGGAVTATAGTSTISFSGGTVGAGGNCTITVDVTGITPGVNNNTTGAITSSNGGTGTTSNTATITVVAPPVIMKAFSSPTILLNGTATLSFTISNPNLTVALTGVGFTDALPAGLQVANPPNATNTCGGAFTPAAGDTTLTYTGGSIAPNSSCTISVVVTATAAGIKNNITSAVTSANGGTGLPSNTATISTFDVCLQDDNDPGLILQYNSTSGDYLFTRCGKKGFTVLGQGNISSPMFCQRNLADSRPDRLITTTYDSCAKTGSASVRITRNGITTTYTINDHRTDDNSCGCPL